MLICSAIVPLTGRLKTGNSSIRVGSGEGETMEMGAEGGSWLISGHLVMFKTFSFIVLLWGASDVFEAFDGGI